LRNVKIIPESLNGRVKIPPSKSLSHRAIIAASLGNGVSVIENVVLSQDIKSTIEGMKTLGADIEINENTLRIKGRYPLKPISDKIDCKESGSTLRFLIPLALLTNKEITFHGSGGLVSRPINSYVEILNSQSIKYKYYNELPLIVEGNIKPDIFKLRGDISSQFITGLLFALPLLEDKSTINITTDMESKGYIDLTINILKKFGVSITNNKYKQFIIKGNQIYKPINYRVEGDYSQAAFWIVAALLGGEIIIDDLDTNSLQGDRVIVDIIKDMGGCMHSNGDSIKIAKAITKGRTIDVSQCPDLVPILAVLGALSRGRTNLVNAKRLRIKESDRLKSIATELNKLGADVVEKEDSLVIDGKEELMGGVVDSWNDHRIAMALAIASIKCTQPVIITNSDSINKSYPDFFRHFENLGGNVSEWNMGK